jgi:hypothetical protein
MTFYMSKYQSKLPNEVTEFAPLIMKSKDDARLARFMPAMMDVVQSAQDFPSTAPDKLETKRISQYFLNKTLNKASGLEEFSSHQHAALLLGKDSFYTSEAFVSCSILGAAQAFLKLI